jgi:hypothetical protein
MHLLKIAATGIVFTNQRNPAIRVMEINWPIKVGAGAATIAETTTTLIEGTIEITNIGIPNAARRDTEDTPVTVIMVTLMFSAIVSTTTRGIGDHGTIGKNIGGDTDTDSIVEDTTGRMGVSFSDFVIQTAAPAFSFRSGDRARKMPRS